MRFGFSLPAVLIVTLRIQKKKMQLWYIAAIFLCDVAGKEIHFIFVFFRLAVYSQPALHAVEVASTRGSCYAAVTCK